MLTMAGMIAVATVFLSIWCVFIRIRRKSLERIVHLPFFLAVVGMVCGGILSIPAVVCAMEGDRMAWFFCAAVLGCDSLMIAYRNCVIRYDENGFTARNFLGIRRSCGFGDVEGVRTGRDIRVYFGGHWVQIDESSCGKKEFMKALKKGYIRERKKLLPQAPSFKRRWDPMNGHLDHPWFYFLLWIVMAAFCLAIPGMAIYAVTAGPVTEPLNLREVIFTRWEQEGQTVRFYISGEETPYTVEHYGYYNPELPAPQTFCGSTCRLGTEEERRHVLFLASEDGTEYITPERERQAYRDSQYPAVWIMCILCSACAVFCVFGILVARHPERYSKKFRRLFYQDGYLH